MEGIIVFLIIIAIIVCIVIYNIINNKHLEIVKKYSELYQNIQKLNSQYKFYKVSNTRLNWNTTLKSKRSLENLVLYDYAKSVISESLGYYASLFDNIDKNIQDYSEYTKKYKSIEKYTGLEEYNKFENVKISYKEFNRCEKSLYKKMVLKKPITDISVHCHASYTSPSGRNSYWKDRDFSFAQLKGIVYEINEENELKMAVSLRKAQLAEEKRAKEKRLRELDKLEVKLAQKEQEINKKEKEFLEATKEHIYTADKIETKKQEIEIDENLSLTQKLKLLKEKFDNGEITYEEYQAKRKELI